MYDVDDKDRVIPLLDVPRSSVGAPIPFVVADELRVVLAYYLDNTPPKWDGRTVRVVGPSDASEPVCIVRFSLCHAHMFGPPNDEAFAGHPLASRGLQPYRAFEVESSSWIRGLERMNAVHPHHAADQFRGRRHFVFAFNDSTFECISDRFDLTLAHGSIQSIVPEMVRLLEWGAG